MRTLLERIKEVITWLAVAVVFGCITYYFYAGEHEQDIRTGMRVMAIVPGVLALCCVMGACFFAIERPVARARRMAEKRNQQHRARQQERQTAAASGIAAAKRHQHQGQAGEAYCSEACLELSSKTLSVAWLSADSGPCTFCQRPVVYGQGHKTMMFPYRNQKAFLCADCREQGRAFFAQVRECCLCGKNL